MKALYLAAAFLVAACAQEEEHGGEIWVQVLQSDNIEFIQAAREAAAQWDICPGHKVHVITEPMPNAATLALVDASDPELKGHIGVTTLSARRVKVSNTVPSDILPGLISHEFGHLLGHITHTKSGIMKDGITTPMTVSPEDCE